MAPLILKRRNADRKQDRACRVWTLKTLPHLKTWSEQVLSSDRKEGARGCFKVLKEVATRRPSQEVLEEGARGGPGTGFPEQVLESEQLVGGRSR